MSLGITMNSTMTIEMRTLLLIYSTAMSPTLLSTGLILGMLCSMYSSTAMSGVQYSMLTTRMTCSMNILCDVSFLSDLYRDITSGPR